MISAHNNNVNEVKEEKHNEKNISLTEEIPNEEQPLNNNLETQENKQKNNKTNKVFTKRNPIEKVLDDSIIIINKMINEEVKNY
jgi:hypothetical protein